MAKKRMAWETAHYLGVQVDGEGEETIHLLGVGIKSLNRSPSPKTTTDAYINEKNGSPTITGYDNSFALNYDDIVDDDAVKALQRVADDQLTGTDAEFYYYRVDLLAEAEAGAYPARRSRCVRARRRDQRGRERCDCKLHLAPDRGPRKRYVQHVHQDVYSRFGGMTDDGAPCVLAAWRAACET